MNLYHQLWISCCRRSKGFYPPSRCLCWTFHFFPTAVAEQKHVLFLTSESNRGFWSKLELNFCQKWCIFVTFLKYNGIFFRNLLGSNHNLYVLKQNLFHLLNNYVFKPIIICVCSNIFGPTSHHNSIMAKFCFLVLATSCWSPYFLFNYYF